MAQPLRLAERPTLSALKRNERRTFASVMRTARYSHLCASHLLRETGWPQVLGTPA